MNTKTYKLLSGLLIGALAFILINFILVPRWHGKAAMQSLIGTISYPEPVHLSGAGIASLTTNIVDTSSTKLAFLMQAPKTGNIHKIGFRLATVTTSSTLNIRIEGVSSTGTPSGVLFGGGAGVDQVASTTGKFYIVTLGANAAVTQGDKIAIVLAATSTVLPNFTVSVGAGALYGSAYPTAIRQATSGAAWALPNLAPTTPIAYVEYDDGSAPYIPGVYPFGANVNITFSSTSASVAEIGAVINVPFKASVSGMFYYSGTTTSTPIFLYDSDGTTVLASTTSPRSPTAASTNVSYALFPKPVTLNPNTSYRVTLRSVDTTNDTFGTFPVGSSTTNTAMPGGGTIYLTNRTSTNNAWTDTSSTFPLAGLLINGLSDDVQTGGGSATSTRSWWWFQ